MTVAPIEESLLELAVELATGAGALTRKWFDRGTINVDTKEDGSPVTEADKAAERYLREQISLAFPTDAIIGEEEEDRSGTSGRTWIIDPIDGTKSFTHGVPLYGTLLAVTDELAPPWAWSCFPPWTRLFRQAVGSVASTTDAKRR